MIAQKQTKQKQGLFIHKIKSLEILSTSRKPKKVIVGDKGDLSLALTSFLLPQKTTKLISRLYKGSLKISNYSKTSPGIVTAANEFFIINKQRVNSKKLEKYALPIVKRGSFVGNIAIFRKEEFKKIEEKNDCFLLSIKEEFDTLDEGVKRYILQGQNLNYHTRYKCRNREKWYDVPIVLPAAGFVFKRCHEMPRLLVNEAEVYTTDTAYGIYPNSGVSIEGITYSFYNSLTLLFAEIKGRFYGGGVLELSPSEFRSLPLIYHEPSEKEYRQFLKLFDKYGSNSIKIIDFGDAWMKDRLSLTDEELKIIRDAWLTIKQHRLRHSSRTLSM